MVRRKKYRKSKVSGLAIFIYSIIISIAAAPLAILIILPERAAIINFVMDNTITIAVILTIIVAMMIINKIIEKQREALIDEILEHLNLSNIDDMLKRFDDQVIVKSKQTLQNYDEVKYLKEHNNLDDIKHIVLMRQDIKKNIEGFLKGNEFVQRPQYKYAANWLGDCLSLTNGYRAKIVYITSAGNNRGEKLIRYSLPEVIEFEEHPEYLMTKKEVLENQKHNYYNKVNSIIDFANSSKDNLIVKSRIKMLDELIQQLFCLCCGIKGCVTGCLNECTGNINTVRKRRRYLCEILNGEIREQSTCCASRRKLLLKSINIYTVCSCLL